MSRIERRLQEEHDIIEEKVKTENGLSVRKVIVLVLAFLLLVGLIVIGASKYIESKLNKIETVSGNSVDVEQFSEHELSCVDVDGYINLLVLGVDAREGDLPEDWRTDAIMIASIKEETGEIHLTSIYRDTFLLMGNQGFYDKVTHAFSYGGVKETIKTINQALDLNIKNYVLFNINGCVDVIDAMGGVELDIEEYEIDELNYTNTGTWKICGRDSAQATQVEHPGKQVVDGTLAVSYGRIRKGVGDDYKRTERMRIVIAAMLDKAKTMGVKGINTILDVALSQVKTNLTTDDMMTLGFRIMDYSIKSTSSFPYTISDGYLDSVSYVFPTDLFGDVKQLHRKSFGQYNYVPSKTVQDMSDIIYAYAVESSQDPGAGYIDYDGAGYGGSSNWNWQPSVQPAEEETNEEEAVEESSPAQQAPAPEPTPAPEPEPEAPREESAPPADDSSSSEEEATATLPADNTPSEPVEEPTEPSEPEPEPEPEPVETPTPEEAPPAQEEPTTPEEGSGQEGSDEGGE